MLIGVNQDPIYIDSMNNEWGAIRESSKVFEHLFGQFSATFKLITVLKTEDPFSRSISMDLIPTKFQNNSGIKIKLIEYPKHKESIEVKGTIIMRLSFGDGKGGLDFLGQFCGVFVNNQIDVR